MDPRAVRGLTGERRQEVEKQRHAFRGGPHLQQPSLDLELQVHRGRHLEGERLGVVRPGGVLAAGRSVVKYPYALG